MAEDTGPLIKRDRILRFGSLGLVLLLSVPSKAKDNLHLSCAGSAVCADSGFGILTITSSLPSFNIVDVNSKGASGTAFLAVLVPNTTASFTVTVGGITTVGVEESLTWSSATGKLSTLLGESGLTGGTFSSFQDKSQQAGAGTVSSFVVYEFNLGTYSSAGQGAAGIGTVAIGGTGLPPGTVLYAWVEDANGDVIQQIPLSEAASSMISAKRMARGDIRCSARMLSTPKDSATHFRKTAWSEFLRA